VDEEKLTGGIRLLDEYKDLGRKIIELADKDDKDFVEMCQEMISVQREAHEKLIADLPGISSLEGSASFIANEEFARLKFVRELVEDDEGKFDEATARHIADNFFGYIFRAYDNLKERYEILD
jgi:hypothetical protein